jgi:hypothetical protein
MRFGTADFGETLAKQAHDRPSVSVEDPLRVGEIVVRPRDSNKCSLRNSSQRTAAERADKITQ